MGGATVAAAGAAAEGRGEPPPYWLVVAIAHETEPWAALLEQGRTDQRLVHDDFYDAQPPRLTHVPDELSPAVIVALANVGIEELYSHQRQALYDAFEAPTIVTTGTASGKSLCFQLPKSEAERWE
jgi:DEAD/DEAH box helicase domain-containing protein